MSTAALPVAELASWPAAKAAISSPLALAAMVTIPDAPGGPSRFRVWQHQREILRLLLTVRRGVILKARQLGVSRVLALFSLWFVLAHAGVKAIIVSVGEREAKAFKEHVVDMWRSLPESVRGAFRLGRDNDQVFEIVHADGLRSRLTSLPSSAGRGETAHLLIMDEGAHWEQADERMAKVLPTSADIGQAVLASTANGVGGTFHDIYEGAPANGWSPMFIPADARPDRDARWIEVERAALDDKGPQEYPMSAAEAFLATGRCAFHVPSLQEYLEHRCTPGLGLFTVERDSGGVYADADAKGRWRVWRFRQPGRHYIITADPCGGGGGEDSAAMCVYDRLSWDQVASYHGRPEPDELARDMIRAGWLWTSPGGKPALLVPEINGHGAGVMAILRERRYRNIWSHTRIDQRRDERQIEYGWNTTTQTRRIALASLKEGIRKGQLGIRDAAAIGEMLRFIVKVTGHGTEREEAGPGAHDDRVMAHAIAAVILQRPAAGAVNLDQAAEEDFDPWDDAPVDGYTPRVSAITGY